jgi:hypothetical protein
MSSIGNTPSLTSDSANENHPTTNSIGITPSLTTDSVNEHSVRTVNVQEQNSLASDLTTSTAIANSNQTTTTAASTSYMSLNVEQFPSLEAFYSALQNATAGNSGLLSGFVQGSVTSTARSLLPEYIAGNGFIASDRMTAVVQEIQGSVEDFQRRNIDENTIHIINGPLIEWAIKSTIENL